jgi:6-pyruvoyltetrahydropterin/6-carboxytetrahydropterin synthase
MNEVFWLQVEDHIDSAHYLKGYNGKCSREHGHRWSIKACFRGTKLDEMNMLIDFSVVKKAIMKPVLDGLDHQQLNDVLDEEHPTAEHLAKTLYEAFWDRLLMVVPKSAGISLESVEVFESPECGVKYSPEKEENEV